MIYLAILLILMGFLILLLSVFAEVVKKAGAGVPPSHRSADVKLPENQDAEPGTIHLSDYPGTETGHYMEEDLFIDFSDESPEPYTLDLTEEPELVAEADGEEVYGLPSGTSVSQEDGSCDPDSVSAVLFDDRSNMIDYDAGGVVLDPTLSGYKNIKRIGKGTLCAENDGLSFYSGDNFYRFDFHKIFDVWSGPNFVALPLRGASTVKLFLVDKGKGFPDRVESYFQEYIKG